MGGHGAAPYPPHHAHLHRPVHVEVVQEGVLHLAQHPAEEEEDLLPHPGGVLVEGKEGRASAPSFGCPQAPAELHNPPSVRVCCSPK